MYRSLACLILITLAAPAAANAPLGDVYCDSSEALTKKLRVQFGEEQQGLGMHGPESVMELWSHPANGNWTLVKRYASGRACVVALGESWATMAPLPDPA